MFSEGRYSGSFTNMRAQLGNSWTDPLILSDDSQSQEMGANSEPRSSCS